MSVMNKGGKKGGNKKVNGPQSTEDGRSPSSMNLLAAQLANCSGNSTLSKPAKKMTILKKKVVKKGEDEGLKNALALKAGQTEAEPKQKKIAKRKKDAKPPEKQASGECVEASRSNTSMKKSTKKSSKDEIGPTPSKVSLKEKPKESLKTVKRPQRKNGTAVKKDPPVKEARRALDKRPAKFDQPAVRGSSSSAVLPFPKDVIKDHRGASPAASATDVLKCVSFHAPTLDENDFWGNAWKDGVKFDPTADEEFISKLKSSDKRVWKGTKFKKRVSRSPVLSEIDEEPDERYDLVPVKEKKFAREKNPIRYGHTKFVPVRPKKSIKEINK